MELLQIEKCEGVLLAALTQDGESYIADSNPGFGFGGEGAFVCVAMKSQYRSVIFERTREP